MLETLTPPHLRDPISRFVVNLRRVRADGLAHDQRWNPPGRLPRKGAIEKESEYEK
jgi:hypothetical protein